MPPITFCFHLLQLAKFSIKISSAGKGIFKCTATAAMIGCVFCGVRTSVCRAGEDVPPAWPEAIQNALQFENADAWQGGKLVADPIKQGKAALQWSMHTKKSSIKCLDAPGDLSAFNTMSFWVHSKMADDSTFVILFESRLDKDVFSYYSKKVTVDWVGWKLLVFSFESFAQSRNPAGWHKIDTILFTAKGWNQNPNDQTVWVFDDLQFTVSKVSENRTNSQRKLYLKEPAAEDFLTRLRPDHPRLILLDDDLPRIRNFLDTDERGQIWYANITRQAEHFYDKPVSQHVMPDGLRLLNVSREVCDRIYTWGFLYRLRGDRKWLDRAWLELKAVLAFKDWNSQKHYLDTAEMMHAVAIGYDWFYNGFNPAQRKAIRDGLWRLGLRSAYDAYMGPRHAGIKGWPWMTNNWSFVCNGGASIAAMAILDDMPKECSKILNHSFRLIQTPLHHFEPDGAWWEGVGYWGYAMQYFSSYIRSMETAFGTDFGFINALRDKGFQKTGDWPVYLVSPLGGIFNFADSGSGTGSFNHWALFFLASRFQNPLYQQFQEQHALGSVYDILYNRPMKYESTLGPAKLDKYFQGAEVVSLRNSWADRNALFAGMKCGRNGIAHAHQDLGSFVFYGLGEKWFIDPGTESQTYQTHKHHLPRKDFYRIREEGHNTLVFDPDKNFSQNPNAFSQIVDFQSSSREAFAIADLTQAYSQYASSVRRGYRFFDHRRRFLVQDEMNTDGEHDLWWFAHGSEGSVIDVDDTGRIALLKRNGKTCRAYLLYPKDASFTVMDAKPLPTSPNPAIQTSNSKMKKLAIHTKVFGKTTLAVMFEPTYDFETMPAQLPEVLPISEWKLTEPTGPVLARIMIDDELLPDFSKEIYNYTVHLLAGRTTIPKVTAVPMLTDRYDVQTQMPATFPGTVRITVTDKKNSETFVYLIRFVFPRASPKKIKDKSLSVSASEDDGNGPENVFDDNLDTRWSAYGAQQWIGFEFDQPRQLSAVGLAWFHGEQRSTRFKISVSDDGKIWHEMFAGQSSGKRNALESYALAAKTTTRFVRITCYGNTDNFWNSITEVNFE